MNQIQRLTVPGRYFTAGLLLICLVVLAGCTSSELASGLSEDEAQESMVILQQYGMHPKKVKTGEGKETSWSLQLPAGEVEAANSVLGQLDLPRKKPKGLAEVFNQSGLIPTATEERAMMLLAIQGEIARTLETIEGIVAARVHIVMPEKDPLSDPGQQHSSAGVFLKYESGRAPVTPEEVKQIVAHAVEKLAPEQVAVVMKPVMIDRGVLARSIKHPLGIAALGDSSTVIFILAGVCGVLAIALILAVVRLQSEKRKVLMLRRS